MSLFLCTRMVRTDANGDRITCDMLIRFRVTSYTAGSRATWMQPADPAEFEFVVTGIEFDSGPLHPNQPPDDAPWPLTDEEDASLRQWFDANYDQAYEAAVDAASDEAADRADYEYERRRDEQMDYRNDDWRDAAQ